MKGNSTPHQTRGPLIITQTSLSVWYFSLLLPQQFTTNPSLPSQFSNRLPQSQRGLSHAWPTHPQLFDLCRSLHHLLYRGQQMQHATRQQVHVRTCLQRFVVELDRPRSLSLSHVVYLNVLVLELLQQKGQPQVHVQLLWASLMVFRALTCLNSTTLLPDQVPLGPLLIQGRALFGLE